MASVLPLGAPEEGDDVVPEEEMSKVSQRMIIMRGNSLLIDI